MDGPYFTEGIINYIHDPFIYECQFKNECMCKYVMDLQADFDKCVLLDLMCQLRIMFKSVHLS